MTPEEAKREISQLEGQRTEFKQSFAEQNKAIETLGAFANAEGGTVFFGVSRSGVIKGVSVGKNTLENFANELGRHTDPKLTPSIVELVLQNRVIVAVTVQQVAPNVLVYSFSKPLKRVGRTNQLMSSEEQRQRLSSGVAGWSEESDLPVFEFQGSRVTRTEKEFEVGFQVKKGKGDYVPDLEWRFRGPRFQMEW